MDPSYTNRVGVQAPPNSQNTVPQGTGSVRQIPVRQVPPSGGMMSQQPIIASGPNEMALSGAEGAGGAGKSRKGVIVLIILIALLALVGGGFWLWQSGMLGGNEGQSQQVSDLQEKYNSYVNYVLWGVESSGKPELNATGEVVNPYFEGLQSDETELDTYMSLAGVKFDALKQAYEKKEGDKLDLVVLKSYFEDYASIRPMSQNEMISDYAMDGEEVVKKLIDEKYNISSSEEYLTEYTKKVKELSLFELETIMNIDKAGCLKDEKIVTNCYQMSETDEEKRGKMITDVTEAYYALKNEAFDVIRVLYNELYSGEGGDVE